MELFNNQIAKATKLALPLGWWFHGLQFFTNFVAENLFRLRVVCGCRYPDQELIKSSTSAVAVLQWTLNILVWRLKRIIILISALASSTFPSLKLMVMLCIPITGLVGDTDLYQSGHGMIFCECSTFSENTTRREKAGDKFQSASTGTRMADVDQRFFCHQCSVEIPRFVHGASSYQADDMCCEADSLKTWYISGWLQTSPAQHAILVSW